jgi:hypothetical protein
MHHPFPNGDMTSFLNLNDNAFVAVLRYERPIKYRYKPYPMSFVDVLFLLVSIINTRNKEYLKL